MDVHTNACKGTSSLAENIQRLENPFSTETFWKKFLEKINNIWGSRETRKLPFPFDIRKAETASARWEMKINDSLEKGNQFFTSFAFTSAAL